jgi:dUTPase
VDEQGDGLEYLFRMQAELQEHLGNDFNAMDGPALIQYGKDMVLAATDELHEALAELYWKPWAAQPPGFKDREAFVGELVDALHFMLNLFLMARVTSDELLDRYGGKNALNRRRRDGGYTGTDKCDGPRCRRALDEPAIIPGTIITWPSGERFCSQHCEADAKARHWDTIREREDV